VTEAGSRAGSGTPVGPGQRLGPYELLAPIGVGGMSEVFRARDARLDREVAVKILDLDAARHPERLRLFEQEARAAGAIAHPAIVTVHDVGREGDLPYVVYELVEGETLERRLGRGRLPVRRAAEVASDIAGGLAAAHARGILHNDLKPGNVLLTPDGRVKILDFGLAGLRQEAALEDPPSVAPGEMPTRAFFGTPGYVAPERLQGEPPSPRSDVFSLGAVLYEMLSGSPPFTGPTPTAVLTATAEEDPARIGVTVPPAIERIARRALEKDPGRRFQSASDLAFALEAVLPPPARPAGGAGSGSGRAWSRPARSPAPPSAWPWAASSGGARSPPSSG
jgi:serine/threonine protein kinase